LGLTWQLHWFETRIYYVDDKQVYQIYTGRDGEQYLVLARPFEDVSGELGDEHTADGTRHTSYAHD
jgi:hypothetical protein